MSFEFGWYITKDNELMSTKWLCELYESHMMGAKKTLHVFMDKVSVLGTLLMNFSSVNEYWQIAKRKTHKNFHVYIMDNVQNVCNMPNMFLHGWWTWDNVGIPAIISGSS